MFRIISRAAPARVAAFPLPAPGDPSPTNHTGTTLATSLARAGYFAQGSSPSTIDLSISVVSLQRTRQGLRDVPLRMSTAFIQTTGVRLSPEGSAMAWPRTSRHSRGYDSRWDKLRASILTRDKRLCQQCKREGIIALGNQVDHIVPKAKGGTDDPANLEVLCKRHHDEKTTRDQGYNIKPRLTFGADGWPVV